MAQNPSDPSVATVRPASRMRGALSLLISLKRLRLRADRAAAFRAGTPEEKRWCLQIADCCDLLIARWFCPGGTEPGGAREDTHNGSEEP